MARLGLFAVGAVALTIPIGCAEDEAKNLPEIVISNDRIVKSATAVHELVEREIGINTISFYAREDLSLVAVILDRKLNTKLTGKKNDPKTYIPKDGFVPFDPTFNLPSTLEHLKRKHQSEKPVILNPSEATDLTILTSRISENDPGLYFVYNIPQLDTDYMYVFDSRGIFTFDGKEPPTSILRAKFRFTKQLSSPSLV